MGRATSDVGLKQGGIRKIRHEDTIFALASGGGRAAIAVIRISGPEALAALRTLTGTGSATARALTLGNLVDPSNRLTIDRGMVVTFPAPGSFTGEDMAEIHIHGGRAVLSRMIDVLSAIPGLRPAMPGEFTRRSYENGKLDLTAAEGIADLVNAETELQRRQALRQMEGELGRIYESWREGLVRALAQLEAYIDFPDENLPEGLLAAVRRMVEATSREIAAHLADNRRGERLREGISVAILGAPNSGKSSLLNYLAGRDAAIVSERAGTTRDVVEVRLDLGGQAVDLADTAGLRDAVDDIEREGVRRALEKAERADVNILLFDGAALPDMDPATSSLLDGRALPVISRADLATKSPPTSLEGAIRISATLDHGLTELLASLRQRVEQLTGLAEAPALTRARHRQGLEAAKAALESALSAEPLELIAEDLRLAVRSIGSVTGRVDIEEVLDVIFRDFCIGK